MNLESYFYNCSPEYIDSIDSGLLGQITKIIKDLPKRQSQSEIVVDLFWLLTSNNWVYPSIPSFVNDEPPADINISYSFNDIKELNRPELCTTSLTIDTQTRSDFAKNYGKSLVQIETQFNDMEALAQDVCKFRIAFAEKRLALGIEVVLYDPKSYFENKKDDVSWIAHFDTAKNTLATLALDCPIWLIGIKE